MKSVLFIFCSILCIGAQQKTDSIPSLYWNLDGHLKHHYVDNYFIPDLIAIASTSLLIDQGIDASIQRWSAKQNETVSVATSAPGLIGGMVAPIIVPLAIFWSYDDTYTQTGALAAGQAVLIAFSTNTLMKAITGRSAPDAQKPKNRQRRSEKFNFGFLRNGTFDGWPSGHAMTNMALASSLSHYFYDSSEVAYWSYGWATYVMISATIGIQGGVHWFSDVLAGGYLGYLIGRTVGQSFSDHHQKKRSFSIYPAPMNNGTFGFGFSYSF